MIDVKGLGLIGRMLAFSLAVGIQVSVGATQEGPPSGNTPGVPEAIEAIEIGAVEASTGALLLSGQAGGDVDGALIWSLDERREDGRAGLPFVVEVDGEALLSDASGRHITIGLYAYIIDGDGRIVDHIAQGLILESSSFSERISATGLKFSGRFSLLPGDYALRVMIRNQGNSSFFMSWGLVTVPAPDDSTMHLLPPLLPDGTSDWVFVKQAGTDSPVDFGKEGVPLPSARPALVEDRPGAIWLGGGGWGKDARVGVRVVNGLGRTVSEPVVEIDEPSVGAFGFRRAAFSPVDIPPGNYTLIVTLSEDLTGSVVRRALPVVVVSERDPPVWTSARSGYLPAVDRAAEEDKTDDSKIKKSQARKMYRQALFVLGEGDAAAARRAVAKLERRAVAGSGMKAGKLLGEAEYAESKEVAKVNPEGLIPMAFLHRELYRSYAARSEGELAAHSRRIAITYAEQLARLEPENGFSESLMVNMAADLAQTGASSGAHELLERTVRLNPGYRAALLSLGFSDEQSGEYFDAAMTYRRLVQAHPADDEGRLRLAINLNRIGYHDEGLEILVNLIGEGGTPWVQTIAVQEVVRYLVDTQKNDEAEQMVRAALIQTPDDQRLWILLAGILEESNRHDEAIEVASHLPPAGRGVSPRARYSEWPSLGVGASQGALSVRSAEALPALKSALDGGGGDN